MVKKVAKEVRQRDERVKQVVDEVLAECQNSSIGIVDEPDTEVAHREWFPVR